MSEGQEKPRHGAKEQIASTAAGTTSTMGTDLDPELRPNAFFTSAKHFPATMNDF